LNISSGTALLVAVVGAVGWVTSEVIRRSDPRRLEQLATVINQVSKDSPHGIELQREIDRLALRIAVKRRRPNYSLVYLFGVVFGAGTLYLLFNYVVGLVLSINDPSQPAPPLRWQFWIGYVVTCVAILARRAFRSRWFNSEYRRISREAETKVSWRWFLTS
jgi:hypothetical protein